MIEKKIKSDSGIDAVLVGLIQQNQGEELEMEYLEELKFLAETAGATTLKIFTQKLSHPDSRTFVGKGKLEEIKKYVSRRSEELLMFDE